MPPLPHRLLASLAVAVALSLFFWMIHVGALAWGTLLLWVLILTLFIGVPRLIYGLFERTSQWSNERTWRDREGRHHEFDAIPMDLKDEADALWIEVGGLRRALGVVEPDDVFATRAASGRWKREGARLWLQAAAVVQHLGEGPEREDTRRQRVRRWLRLRQQEFEVRRQRSPSRP